MGFSEFLDILSLDFLERNYSSSKSLDNLRPIKYFATQIPWKNFQGRPRKKIQKSEKFFSGILCFEKLEQYLGGLAIFHKPLVCEGLRKIAKPHKFGFSIWKQRIPKIFQMQLFSTGPVVHLGVVQSTWNFGSRPKIGIYEHFIFYILSFWPTVTALVTPLLWAVHSVTVSLIRQWTLFEPLRTP